jgi:putative tryptophan/tyrosine transport system substrate-binding protein
VKRREFITLLGSAAAMWPLMASAQQSALPVIGFLDPRSLEGVANRLRGFRQGLKETGYIEGENVTIEYRWAENQMDRLPELTADLVRRQPAVIVASGGRDQALAAKAATTTIPVLFLTGEDPVRLGLVASLARPAGNLTGVNFFNAELATKRLELFRELVPGTKRIAVLINPADVTNADSTVKAIEPAAQAIGLQIQILNASTSREIDAAFAIIGRDRPEAIYVGQTPFLNARRVQLAQLAARYMVPASYSGREFPEVGGLMSYGSDIADAYRQVGIYAGRILKGAKVADLPVVQANKFELVINAQTARMLGLDLPAQLLARTDEVIE